MNFILTLTCNLGSDKMSTLITLTNKAIVVIKDSKNFIQDFNKNKVGEDF